MRKSLTLSFCAAAAAEPGAERTVYWDTKQPSFGLTVTSAGAKSYVVQYRRGSASRRMTLKNALTLAQARKEAKALLGEVARGGDPLSARRKEKEKDTLQSVAEEYLKREGKSLRSIDHRRAVFERLIYPKLGACQIADIGRLDIVHLLDRIDDERGPTMADMTLAVLRRLMSRHASRSNEFRSPIVRGMARTKPKERARTRVLSDDEIRAVWNTAESFDGPWGRYVQFLLLTATRRNEATQMRWDELSGDDFIIPAGRSKSKHEVVLPLSKQARALLTDLPRIHGSPYVFTIGGRNPIAGFSKFKKRFDQACGVTGWRVHDLRRTARTQLARAGVNSDIAERCLAHTIQGVRGVYDRHSHRQEMLQGFEALSAQIERILNPHENVVAFLK